jgi:hypothetical protein
MCALAAALAAALLPAPARAVVGDSDLHFRLFKINAQGGRDTLDAAQISRQFAQAVCLCQERFDLDVYLTPTVAAMVGSLTSGKVELWAGSNCNDNTVGSMQPRDERCNHIMDIPLTQFTHTVTYHLTADQFSVATIGSAVVACAPQQATPGLWALVDENSDGQYEASSKFDIPYDGLPPTEPINISASGGNEAVALSWDLAPGNVADVDGFQILCARGNGLQVFKDGTFSIGFKTTLSECPGKMPLSPPDGGPGLPPDAGVADAATATTVLDEEAIAPAGDGGIGFPGGRVAPPYGPFLTANPHFICSDRMAKTVRNVTIRGLQNDIPYEFAVLAVDKVGNPSTVREIHVVFPAVSIDGYQNYLTEGGKSSGGFCAVAPHARAYLLAPLVLALAVLLGLRLRRKR